MMLSIDVADEDTFIKVLEALASTQDDPMPVKVEASEWDLGEHYDDIPWDGVGEIEMVTGGHLWVRFNDWCYQAAIPLWALATVTVL